MIDADISQGKYDKTIDNTHQDLKTVQNFLYRHFYKTEHPISNEPHVSPQPLKHTIEKINF